ARTTSWWALVERAGPLERQRDLVQERFEKMQRTGIKEWAGLGRPHRHNPNRSGRADQGQVQGAGSRECVGPESGPLVVLEHPLGNSRFFGVKFKIELFPAL